MLTMPALADCMSDRQRSFARSSSTCPNASN
jgi:hypothetical protein